jgi:hypothetical protein
MLRRFRAWLTGYFWLPCPQCGQMFAGYEEPLGSIETTLGSIETTLGQGRVTCPACALGRC